VDKTGEIDDASELGERGSPVADAPEREAPKPADAASAGASAARPAERRRGRRGEGEPARAGKTAGLKVLFIDDESVNLRVGQRFLDKLGCEHKCLDDGEFAMEEIEKAEAEGKPFDVLLVDIIMQRVNGVEVCKAVRARGLDVPVVAMTAVTGRANLVHFKTVGFNLVLAKPFGKDAFEQAILEAVRQREARRARGGAVRASDAPPA
jgi:CheY-like chemotaxis protein